MFKLFTLALMITMPSGHRWIVLAHGPTVRQIQGIVELYDAPMDGMVVELYDNPEVMLTDKPLKIIKQQKIASVTTDRNGKFKFKNIRSGKYELRVAPDVNTGINTLSIIVKVRRLWFWPLGRAVKVRLSY